MKKCFQIIPACDLLTWLDIKRFFRTIVSLVGLCLCIANPGYAYEWLQDGICRNWGVTPELFYFSVPAQGHWSAVAVSPMVSTDTKQIRIWGNETDHLQVPLPAPLAFSEGHDGTEFVVGDLTAAPAAYYYPEVYGDLPTTMYVINWAQSWNALALGTLVDMNLGGMTGECGLIRIWELDLEAGQTYRFTFTTGGAADVRTALFQSSGAGSWQGRGQAAFEITAAQAPYDYTAPASGTYGLVVFNNAKEAASGNFQLRVDLVQSTPLPDLVIETIHPATTVAGQSTTISVTVKNQGAAPAAASSTRVSLDGSIVCSSIATAAIAAGQTQVVTCSLPAQTQGSYTIEACADVNGDVPEVSEGNNCDSSGLTVNPSGTTQYPNLIVSYSIPATAVEGQGIDLLGYVLNTGTANAPASYTRVRVDGIVRCAAVATGPITIYDKIAVPCSIGPLAVGSHSVEFCADTTGIVAESNEADNCHTETLTITPAPRPDLVIDSISPDDISEGQPTTVSIVVRNQGIADAPATQTRLSLLKAGGPWDIATPAISAGSSRTVTQSVGYLPVGTVPATACADYTDVADESVEFNNCVNDTIRVRPLSITVYPDGSGSYPTIQSAMDAVAAGGYVLLADGIFTGTGNRDLDFRGRSMKVGNLAGAAPVIDCEYAQGNEHRGFYFHTAEGRDSEVFGITITNGHPTYLYPGGAVRIIGASPTFRDCTFSNCQAMLMGGAVSVEAGGAPRFTGCRFIDNAGIGGGLFSDSSTPEIENSIFTGNFNSAIVSAGTSFVSVTGCTIDANTLGVACMNAGKVDISHSIVSFSTEPTAEAVYCAETPGCAAIACTNVYGNAGGDWVGSIAGMNGVDGNFSADPLYCDAPGGDLQLMADSLCAAENNAGCGRVGALGVDCPASSPRTFVIRPDGTGDRPTIQDALNSAWDGDVIELTDGTFVRGGNLNLSLDGSAGRGALTIRSRSGDPSACALDLEGTPESMRYGFKLSGFGSGPQAVLEGFTLRNGYTPSGGGLTCDGSSPILRNLVFENCRAVGSAPDGYGGAIYAVNGSHPQVTDSVFDANSAGDSGGAVYLSGGSISLVDCSFTGNAATLYGGAVFQRSDSEVTIEDTTFAANTAQDGAGIYSRDTGSLTALSRCTLADNIASGSGGGLYGRVGIGFDLDDCTLSGNSATYGGGLYTVFSCNTTLDGCTVYGNSASSIAGGLRIYTESTATVTNSILWANTAPNGPQVGLWSTSSLSATCSDIQGGTAAIYMDAGSTVSWGSGNIDQDPLFCDAPGNDFHLHASSACAAANNPSCGRIGAWAMRCGPYTFNLAADGSGDYATLAEAVDAAWDEVTVLLGNGTYTGTGNKNIDPRGKAITIRSQSDDPAACVIDLQDSGRAFYLHSGEATDTVISGITIMNGYSSDGAGIFCNGAAPTIANCRFVDNTATNAGGGVRVNTAAALISECVFMGNHAVWGGGGLYNFHASPKVTGCTFTDNTSDHWGGGMHNQYADSLPLITGCAFTGNSAAFGGGIFNRGGASPVVAGCTFDENLAATNSGGGMYTQDSGSPKVVNCRFRGNSAADDGGGMYNNNACDSTVANTVFSGNWAADKAGGLYLRDHDTSTVANCTFSLNHSAYGGGIYVWNYGTPAIANSIFWGNTAANGAQIGVEAYSTAAIHHSDLQDGLSGIYLAASGAVNWGSGNLTDEDPRFVDADGPDNIAGTPDDNLHLGTGSLCIDSGDNGALPPDHADLDADGDAEEPLPLDVDGDARVVDGDSDTTAVVDMGADENIPVTSCEGDLDLDGDVDGSDLAVLAADPAQVGLGDFAIDFGKAFCE